MRVDPQIMRNSDYSKIDIGSDSPKDYKEKLWGTSKKNEIRLHLYKRELNIKVTEEESE